MKNREITELGLILAIAFVLSYMESCIPVFIAVPGVKLGLANIATMYVLYRYTPWKAVVFMILRVLLTSFLFAGLNTMIFGLVGGSISIICMLIAMKIKKFSVLGISMTGAIAHNFGQIIVACIVMSNINVFYYLPILIITGLISGFFVGYLTALLMKRTVR